MVVAAANFTPMPLQSYRIGVPLAGIYREALNSDASKYGGSGVVNEGDFATTEGEWQGQPHSIVLTLPPLGVIYLKPA